MNILEVEHLKTYFLTEQGIVRPVRDVSFTVQEGEILGIVGESGSGKSVTMLSVMGLLAKNGYVGQGTVRFDGQTLMDLPEASGEIPFSQLRRQKREYEKKMEEIRGREIGMIFQDPMTFLNPILTVGYQMSEGLRRHFGLSRPECRKKNREMLNLVGITNAEQRLSQYPFELSGGMRQRVLIASALGSNPKLLIADEPTTALDVTIQAQILQLIGDLKEKIQMATVLITHDLGVVASVCTRILILYGGEIVEEGTDREIFYEGKHPYTEGLLNSVAKDEALSGRARKLVPIEGSPPDLLKPPAGCSFADRCRYAMRICKERAPENIRFSDTHSCKCWLSHPEVEDRLGAWQQRRTPLRDTAGGGDGYDCDFGV